MSIYGVTKYIIIQIRQLLNIYMNEKYNVLTVYVMCPLITRNKRRLLHNITHYIHSVLSWETCLSVYSWCVHM